MIGEIRRLVSAQPFIPFTIHLADGGELRVPKLDHIFVFPTGSRVIVTKDDDTWEVLSPLLMSRITVDARSAERAI
jgi:hypothetical protein